MKVIDSYLKKILGIIALFDIIAVILYSYYPNQSLGFILGSIASAVNMVWLANSVRKNLLKQEKESQVSSLKSFYLRYPSIILYSVAIIYFVKVSIIFFGIGLLTGQIAIYLIELKNIIHK
jgi:Na+/H+-translocating membrane pyrophosphatase